MSASWTPEPDIMSWLVISIALSVVLTVLLNVLFRAFPGADRRAASAVTASRRPAVAPTRTSDRRLRVWMPWKGMIVGSVVLTIVVNLVLWFARG